MIIFEKKYFDHLLHFTLQNLNFSLKPPLSLTTLMASAVRDLQLTNLPAGRKIAAVDNSDDLENVRLLDSDDGVDDEMRRIQVRVSGMTCTACSNSIESALKAVDGVLTASVALLQNKADVVFNPALVKVHRFFP